ncbi:MAG: coenzyme F420-0:L-glutamate ligase [Nitrososphaeraceae archaeon]
MLNKNNKIEIIPIFIKDNISQKSNITKIILKAIDQSNNNIKDTDIIVIAQKIISKSEGRFVDLNYIKPSQKATEIAAHVRKDAKLVHLILKESKKIVKIFNNNIIVETKHGFICANAGIDKSNVDKNKNQVLLLPEDPDKSANKIRKEVKKITKKDISVVISDTFGRPFRNGQTNIAIGISGINPVCSYIGKKDMFGHELRVTEIAIVDEIAGASELVMRKTNKVPVAIVRGLKYSKNKSKIKYILRDEKLDMFRTNYTTR